MKAELKRIAVLQGYDMDIAYDISQIKEEVELYKGEELKFRLSKIAYNKSKDKTKTEQKILVDNDLFERCLYEMNSSHAESARKRGFLRARYMPFNYHTDEGTFYRHGIVNIVNFQAKVNKIETNLVKIKDLHQKLNEIKRDSLRVTGIWQSSSEYVTVSYTPQRYDFDN